MRFKSLSAVALTLMMCAAMSSTAFAYVDETAATEAAPVETEAVVVEEAENTEEPMAPLTPDGNLTLVDDCGSSTGVGKQFVTMVTKSGNYFYLVIDRDDKGEQTVHFLNQVDEADLFALMDDEEAQKYTEIVEETKPVETESEPEDEPEPEVQQEETKKANLIPALVGVLALLGGGGFFAYKKLSDKKKAEEQKPDQDADYREDDDYEYPDDDDNEEPVESYDDNEEQE